MSGQPIFYFVHLSKICKHMNRSFFYTFSLVLFTLFASVLYHYCNPAPLLTDSTEYLHSANNLLNNNILYSKSFDQPIDYRMYSKRTLGYPIFIVFQLQNQYLMVLASALFYLYLFFLGIQILKKFDNRRTIFLCYGILFLLHIPLLIHVTFNMADIIVAAVVTSIVATEINKRERSTNRHNIIALFWAVGLLLKPVFLPSLIFIPFVLLYYKKKYNNWRIVYFTPFLIWIMGCTVNYYNAGVFEYSSISTINFGQYNAKLMLTEAEGLEQAQVFASSESFQTPKTKSEYLAYKNGVRQESIKVMRENPLSYIKVHVAGIVKMILDPGRFELYTFFTINDHNISLTELIYSGNWPEVKKILQKNGWVLTLFILLLVVSLLKTLLAFLSLQKIKSLLFPTAVMLYFLIVTGPVGAARFMLPISIVYLTFVSIGAGIVLTLFQKRAKG